MEFVTLGKAHHRIQTGSRPGQNRDQHRPRRSQKGPQKGPDSSREGLGKVQKEHRHRQQVRPPVPELLGKWVSSLGTVVENERIQPLPAVRHFRIFGEVAGISGHTDSWARTPPLRTFGSPPRLLLVDRMGEACLRVINRADQHGAHTRGIHSGHALGAIWARARGERSAHELGARALGARAPGSGHARTWPTLAGARQDPAREPRRYRERRLDAVPSKVGALTGCFVVGALRAMKNKSAPRFASPQLGGCARLPPASDKALSPGAHGRAHGRLLPPLRLGGRPTPLGPTQVGAAAAPCSPPALARAMQLAQRAYADAGALACAGARFL